MLQYELKDTRKNRFAAYDTKRQSKTKETTSPKEGRAAAEALVTAPTDALRGRFLDRETCTERKNIELRWEWCIDGGGGSMNVKGM